MNLTLLLDLDDTLLGNSLDTFVPAYIKGLAKRLAPHVAPEKMIPALLSATQAMMQNGRCDRRLEETFSQAFYPVLGLDPEEVRPTLDAFYAEDFPTLARYTQKRPEAYELVRQALDRGYRVAVATAPLFPKTAIWQRLGWAGLPPEEISFELISSFESFHFSKPSPAYFAEFMAQMGWPEESVIMVGDDPDQDIKPARALGIPVFWTPTDPQRAWDDPASPAPPQGTLADLLPWIESQPKKALQPNFNTPQAIQAIFQATPAALATLVARQDPQTWNTRPATGEWCAAEIICHLRDVENEVNLPRLERILKEANPFITGQDTDAWAEQRQYITQDLRCALHTFSQQRCNLLAELDRLEAGDWQRQIRHAIFGPTNFQDLMRIMADHDRLHIQQLFQAQTHG